MTWINTEAAERITIACMFTKKIAMLVASDRSVSPDDLLLWPDGYWCFREEFCKEFLRDDNYREIAHHCDEWLSYVTKPHFLRIWPADR